MNLKALLFDVDGTLAETEGGTLPFEGNKRIMG